jgi:hypothetical protein
MLDFLDRQLIYKNQALRISEELFLRVAKGLKTGKTLDDCLELETSLASILHFYSKIENGKHLCNDEYFHDQQSFDTFNEFRRIKQEYYKEYQVVVFNKKYFFNLSLKQYSKYNVDKIFQIYERDLSKYIQRAIEEKLVERRLREKEKSKASLYLIKKVGTNQYKIGVSKTPLKRISGIQVSNSEKLDVVFITKLLYFAFQKESEIKEQYSNNKIQGEWFVLSKTEELEILNKFDKWEYENN